MPADGPPPVAASIASRACEDRDAGFEKSLWGLSVLLAPAPNTSPATSTIATRHG
jgi:hypothetical protein